jgi:hypothetical protein
MPCEKTDLANLVLQPRLQISILTVDFEGHGAATPIARAALRVLQFIGVLPIVSLQIAHCRPCPCGCGLPVNSFLAEATVTLGKNSLIAAPASPPRPPLAISRN